VDILEALHIVFLVRPYHKNIARAIQKMPKLYFYDTGYVDGDEGIKIENTTAVCLRKHTDFLSDTSGKAVELRYVRTRESRIDFAVTMEGLVSSLIEVKTSDPRIPRALKLLGSRIPHTEKYLLVKNLRLESDIDGTKIRKLSDWLAELKA
jgi:predicted AAA+ superfamily ATPase